MNTGHSRQPSDYYENIYEEKPNVIRAERKTNTTIIGTYLGKTYIVNASDYKRMTVKD